MIRFVALLAGAIALFVLLKLALVVAACVLFVCASIIGVRALMSVFGATTSARRLWSDQPPRAVAPRRWRPFREGASPATRSTLLNGHGVYVAPGENSSSA